MERRLAVGHKLLKGFGVLAEEREELLRDRPEEDRTDQHDAGGDEVA